MKRKKAFTVFIVVLLIGLLIFLVAFVGSPDYSVHVPHELSGNYTTYSNFGFNFSYPVEWHHIFASRDSDFSHGSLGISDGNTPVKRGLWVTWLTSVDVFWRLWSSIKDRYGNLQGYVDHHFEWMQSVGILGMHDTYVILEQYESQVCEHNATVVIANYTTWIAPSQRTVRFCFFWICADTDRIFTLKVGLMRVQVNSSNLSSSNLPSVVHDIAETFSCH